MIEPEVIEITEEAIVVEVGIPGPEGPPGNADVSVYDAHIIDTSGNPHNITTSLIGAATSTDLNNHKVASNPHNITAALIGAASATDLINHQTFSNPHNITTSLIGAATVTDLQAHINANNNPHNITAAQIGAAAEGHIHNEFSGNINGYTEARSVGMIVPSAGILAIDASKTVHHVSLTEDVTAVAVNNIGAAVDKDAPITIRLKQDATGGRVVAWPANWNWGEAGPPTLSTAPNLADWITVVAFYDEGEILTIHAFLGGQGF